MSKVCIIDYKTGGNIFSVENSLKHVGAETLITSDPQEIAKATKIVFPGVGSFKIAAEMISKLGIDKALIEARSREIPILGICVGMQIMFVQGTEGSINSGLGFFEGSVDQFDFRSINNSGNSKDKLKIPHMGWNIVDFNQCPTNPLIKGLKSKENFYFVHSYRVLAGANTNLKIATTQYGEKFISHIWDGKSTWGAQFHIEKSGEAGLQVLKNFLSL